MRVTSPSRFAVFAPLLMAAALFSAWPATAQTPGENINPTTGERARPTTLPITTEVIIPGTGEVLPTSEVEGRIGGFFVGKVSDLAEYLETLYNFVIGTAGLIAATMMIVGGFQYLTSGGDSSRVTAAKSRITNALIGLVLALSAFLLLNTINPALVNFKTPTVESVSSEFAFVPWCEDLRAVGFVVNVAAGAVIGSEGCGSIGVFTNAKGQEDYCVFAGGFSRYSVAIETSTRSQRDDAGASEATTEGGQSAEGTRYQVCAQTAGTKAPVRCTSNDSCIKGEKDTGPCVFRSITDKSPGQFHIGRSGGYTHSHMSTCMQGDYSRVQFYDYVKNYTIKGKRLPGGKVYAAMIGCADLNRNSESGRADMTALGFNPQGNDGYMNYMCQKWQYFANDLRAGHVNFQAPTRDDFGSDTLDRFWNYCAWTDPGLTEQFSGAVLNKDYNKGSCISSFLDCARINRNQEGDHAVEPNSAPNGCEGYDEEPTVNWGNADGSVAYRTYWADLEDFSKHLFGVCASNYCQFYNSNKEVRNMFLGNCNAGRGVTGAIFSLPGLRAFKSDCRNEYPIVNLGGTYTPSFCTNFPAQCS